MWKQILKSESLASIGTRLERLDEENEDGTYEYMYNKYEEVPKEIEDKVIDMIKNKKYTLVKNNFSEENTDFGGKFDRVSFYLGEFPRQEEYLVYYYLITNQTYGYNGEVIGIAKRNNSDSMGTSKFRGYDSLVKLLISEKEGQPRLIED